MEASPVKTKLKAADPWQPAAATEASPVGISVEVPIASSDDALDGFIGAADMGSPTANWAHSKIAPGMQPGQQPGSQPELRQVAS